MALPTTQAPNTVVNPTVCLTESGEYRLYLTVHATDWRGFPTEVLSVSEVTLSLASACYLFDALKLVLPR